MPSSTFKKKSSIAPEGRMPSSTSNKKSSIAPERKTRSSPSFFSPPNKGPSVTIESQSAPDEGRQHPQRIAHYPSSIPPPEDFLKNEHLTASGPGSSLVPKPSQDSIAAPSSQGSGVQKGPRGDVNASSLPRPFPAQMKAVEERRMKKAMELMNCPPEEFKVSESDKRVPHSPQVVLTFHILELTNLTVGTSFVDSLPIGYYSVLSTGPVRRTTKLVWSQSRTRIRIDHTAHLSFDVSEWRKNPASIFRVEVCSFQDPENHYVVGTAEIHQFEFLRKQYAIEKLELRSDSAKAGYVYCEYAMAYGSFGFGHSNQLRNPNIAPMEYVCHSMFPRIGPDDGELIDKVFRVRMPEQLKVFTYNSLILEFGDAVETEGRRRRRVENTPQKPIVLQQVKYDQAGKPIHCKLHMNIHQKELQPDFADTFGEFICLTSRKARMEFLNNLVTGRMRDLYESDNAGSFFLPFKELDAERVQRATINHPGYLVHPTNVPCFTSTTHKPTTWGEEDAQPEVLTKEDNDFQDRFPSYRRGPGFLDVLFGYQKKPDPSQFLNDMEEDLHMSEVPKKSCMEECRSWMRKKLLIIIGFFVVIYNFVFPELKSPPPIPEVSVTLPSPQGSTAKVHTYFVKDHRGQGAFVKSKMQAQTAALLELSEKPLEDPEGTGVDLTKDDDSSSSSSDDEDRAGRGTLSFHPKRRSIKKKPSKAKKSNTQIKK